MVTTSTIKVCYYSSDAKVKSYQIPHPKGCKRTQAKAVAPNVSEKILRIARHLGTEKDPTAGAKLVAKLKNKGVVTFEHSMGRFLEEQDRINELSTKKDS